MVAQRASMLLCKYIVSLVPYNPSLQHDFSQSVLVVGSRNDVMLYNLMFIGPCIIVIVEE